LLVPAPRDNPASSSRPETPAFANVLRGYDRNQVDDHLSRLQADNDAMRRELGESDTRRQRAEQQAAAAEKELKAARATPAKAPQAAPEESFGFRAEKILRLAEQEAAEIRAVTSRDSASLVEKARAEAEKYRHEAEQTLIARSALLDQQAAQRSAELLDREKQVEAQLDSARAEASSVQDAARIAADTYRRQADADAESVRERAALDAARLREQASQEVARLDALRLGTQTELGRLVGLIQSELKRPTDAAQRRQDGSASGAPPVDTPAADRQ
jgi:cell division septum initiation protein DivIVA